MKQKLACWTRFWWEMRPTYAMFALEEFEEGNIIDKIDQADNNHVSIVKTAPQINVKESFAPHRPYSIVIRFILLTWSLHVLYKDLAFYPPHNLYIYMGFLTHWGMLLSIAYFLCSFLCTIIPGTVQQPESKSPSSSSSSSTTTITTTAPSRLVCLTWGLYSTVAPLEMSITCLYWSFVSAFGPISYVSIMEHGGISLLILLDGNWVGIVPVRAKHLVFLMFLCILYCAWSILDSVLEIGNGEWGPAYGDDDALYPVLNWNSDRELATIVSALAICVVAPGIFLGCYWLSLRPKSWNNQESNPESVTISTSGCHMIYLDGSIRPTIRQETIRSASKEQEKTSSSFDYESLHEVI